MAFIHREHDTGFFTKDLSPPCGITVSSVCVLRTPVAPNTRAVGASRSSCLPFLRRQVPEVTSVTLIRFEVATISSIRINGSLVCFKIGAVLGERLPSRLSVACRAFLRHGFKGSSTIIHLSCIQRTSLAISTPTWLLRLRTRSRYVRILVTLPVVRTYATAMKF